VTADPFAVAALADNAIKAFIKSVCYRRGVFGLRLALTDLTVRGAGGGKIPSSQLPSPRAWPSDCAATAADPAAGWTVTNFLWAAKQPSSSAPKLNMPAGDVIVLIHG